MPELKHYEWTSYLSKISQCKLNDALAIGESEWLLMIVASFDHAFESFEVTCPLEPKKCANLYFQKNDSAKTSEILARQNFSAPLWYKLNGSKLL